MVPSLVSLIKKQIHVKDLFDIYLILNKQSFFQSVHFELSFAKQLAGMMAKIRFFQF